MNSCLKTHHSCLRSMAAAIRCRLEPCLPEATLWQSHCVKASAPLLEITWMTSSYPNPFSSSARSQGLFRYPLAPGLHPHTALFICSAGLPCLPHPLHHLLSMTANSSVPSPFSWDTPFSLPAVLSGRGCHSHMLSSGSEDKSAILLAPQATPILAFIL